MRLLARLPETLPNQWQSDVPPSDVTVLVAGADGELVSIHDVQAYPKPLASPVGCETRALAARLQSACLRHSPACGSLCTLSTKAVYCLRIVGGRAGGTLQRGLEETHALVDVNWKGLPFRSRRSAVPGNEM